MAKLYVITGPAGVGKSTISQKLAESKKKSVVIEGDTIYNQVVGGYVSAWKEGNHLSTFFEVCFATIRIYLENGYDVIFNYILKQEDMKKIQSTFSQYEKAFIVLLANEDILLKRDQIRPEDCQMKERCLILLKEFQEEPFLKQYLLDTSLLTLEEEVTALEDNRFLF